MFYAQKNDDLIEASPKADGYCPNCKEQLISKCGEIKVWHWAHKTNDCDTWHEPEGLWHKNWKELFPKQNREVVIGEHRADIKLDNGLVIEFQHSPISPKEIEEREQFYGNMIWVFDASAFSDRFIIKGLRPEHWDRKQKIECRWDWKHPRESILFCKKPVYLDFGCEKSIGIIQGSVLFLRFDTDRQSSLLIKNSNLLAHYAKKNNLPFDITEYRREQFIKRNQPIYDAIKELIDKKDILEKRKLLLQDEEKRIREEMSIITKPFYDKISDIHNKQCETDNTIKLNKYEFDDLMDQIK